MAVQELDSFRAKYPQYNDLGDNELAGMLAQKYPDSYSDLPAKVQSTGQPAAPPDQVGHGVRPSSNPDSPLNRGTFENGKLVYNEPRPDSGVGIQDMGKKGALPAAGQYVGGKVGGAIAGTPGMVIGEAVGGAGGEIANQVSGITEPSVGQVIAAAAAGPVARGVGAGYQATKRAVGRFLPGAGTALRQEGINAAEQLGPSLAPTTASDVLYDQVRNVNPTIDLKSVKNVANSLLQDETLLLSDAASPLTGNAQKLITDLAGTADQAGFQNVWATMRGINGLIGAAKRQGGPEFGALLQLKKAFAESLDQASASNQLAGQAADLLKKANTAFRQEIASDTVTDIIARNINPREGMEAFNITAGKAMKQLSEVVRKDPFLEGSFKPGDLERVTKTLDEIRQLPVIGASPGADAGSKNMLRRSIIGGGIGELVGHALGLPPGVGGATGTLAGIGTAELVSKALQTSQGSQLLLKLVKSPGGFDYPKLAVMAQFLRAQTAEPGKADFKAVMQNRDAPVSAKIEAATARAQARQEMKQILEMPEY